VVGWTKQLWEIILLFQNCSTVWFKGFRKHSCVNSTASTGLTDEDDLYILSTVTRSVKQVQAVYKQMSYFFIYWLTVSVLILFLFSCTLLIHSNLNSVVLWSISLFLIKGLSCIRLVLFSLTLCTLLQSTHNNFNHMEMEAICISK